MAKSARVFYAIMAVQRTHDNKLGPGIDVFKFKALNAKVVHIVPLFKSFIYLNPVEELYEVCDYFTGMSMGRGQTADEAIADARNLFLQCPPDKLRAQMAGMGDCRIRDEIPWIKAMDCYKALKAIRLLKEKIKNGQSKTSDAA